LRQLERWKGEQLDRYIETIIETYRGREEGNGEIEGQRRENKKQKKSQETESSERGKNTQTNKSR
jgi:hypothetical protein